MTEKTDTDSRAIRSEIEALTDAIDRCEDRSKLGQLFVYRAQYEREIGDDLKAVEDYLDALEVTDDDSNASRIKSAIALVLVTKAERKQDALYWALGAVDRAPEDAEARYVLGLVCDCCGYVHMGIECLVRALKLQPDHVDAMRVLGICYREAFELDKAIEILAEYLSRKPNDPVGLFELGQCFQFAMHLPGARDKANELYERAFALDPPAHLREMIERQIMQLRRSQSSSRVPPENTAL